jgi:NitT/TauT family transport system permease protein
MAGAGRGRIFEHALDRLGRLGRFVWSGWAGLAGVCLLAALWQAGHEAYGDFILPAPLATLSAAMRLLGDGRARDLLVLTSWRALQGFAACALVGGVAGIVAGYSPATLRVLQPILTILLGVPPIAWIVLAMIWFGSGSTTVAATILVSALPLVFAGAVEGVVTRDRGLDAMAQVFGAGPVRRFTHVAWRQIAAHLLPALIIALGTSLPWPG